MKAAVSQKIIAENLGLSRMAVSLALRGSERISAETRKRVRTEAERLGYRRDPTLSALSRYRHASDAGHYRETVAFVTKWREPQGWRENYVYRFFKGARAAADRTGYRIEPFWLGEYNTGTKASAVLAARGIRGLLLAPMEQPGAISLTWDKFATVAVGPTLLQPAVDRVLHDYEGSMRLILEELLIRGYRRPALILPPRVDRITERQVANTFLAEQRRNPALRHALTWFSDDETARTFTIWVRKHRPDCLITLSGQSIEWLRADGWRVPEEIGCVNLHIKLCNAGWSGIDYGAEEIGAAALDRLDLLLQRNALGLPVRAVKTLLLGRWVQGTWVRNPSHE